jgi:hypothetical protein
MTNDEALALLRADIQASGLSARKYAAEVLGRDERHVRRWLAEEWPIPEVVFPLLLARESRKHLDTGGPIP